MKNIYKKTFALLCALCICIGTVCPAWADEAETGHDFSGYTPGEILHALLEEYGTAEDRVYAGYLNLVTGEEYYWQGDELVTAASMYKVPLNMLMAEMMANGDFIWDERVPDVNYDYVLEDTILYSSNTWAAFLWEVMGGYQVFKEGIAPYMGIDLEETDTYRYFNQNEFSPRQMISCLKTLYEGGEERFPRVLDTMKRAEPERFFRMNEDRWEIAQKYGYLSEYASYMNCCGICFTDEPIAIVMFTRSVPYPEELLTAYCTAMCDYAQYQKAQREEQAHESFRRELEDKGFETPVEPVAVESADDAPEAKDNIRAEGNQMATIICCVVVVTVALFALVMIALNKKKYGLKVFWMLISVLLCAAALIMCAVGMRLGTVYAKPEGNPAESVDAFFTAICAKDYDTAYSYLRDYTSLGLENVPQSEAGQIVYSALEGSYRYTLIGECTQDKLDAKQRVSLSYLDLAKTHEDISRVTMEKLEQIVKQLTRDEIYDENDRYRPEVANKAYLQAVNEVMADAGKYSSTAEFEISLVYENGRWQIIAEPALLRALNGGTAY